MPIFRSILFTALLLVLITPSLAAPGTDAPDPNTHYLVFMWEDTLYAHALSSTGELRNLGPDFHGAAQAFQPFSWDVYDLALSPLTEPPADGYGFHHGVWSADKTRFAYLTINAPMYRLYMLVDGVPALLWENTLSPEHGYLDPLGWTLDGKILLSERYMLHHFDTLRVWQLDPASQALTPYANAGLATPNQHLVRGNTMITAGGTTAFLGIELETGIAYFFDFTARTTMPFPTVILMPDPSGSIFNLYPLEVLAVISGSDLPAAESALLTTTPSLTPFPAPFLHWFVPDTFRRVTCYPDSAWTRDHFNVTCPSLHVDYAGHQGTDVSGPVGGSGLPIGTNVYAAAPGLVIKTHTTCQPNNPSCGDAYGNIVMLEHTLVVAGNTQTWYTGYAHLSGVLVEPLTYMSDITVPIGLSGSTGTGGPHAHLEVRSPEVVGWIGWIDPWDTTRSGTDRNLWLGTNQLPVAATSSQNGQ